MWGEMILNQKSKPRCRINIKGYSQTFSVNISSLSRVLEPQVLRGQQKEREEFKRGCFVCSEFKEQEWRHFLLYSNNFSL